MIGEHCVWQNPQRAAARSSLAPQPPHFSRLRATRRLTFSLFRS